MTIANKDPIDVVYTWVDGNDLAWKKKKQKYDSSKINVTKNGTVTARFVDTQELKYSIRSIREYMPWVQNIYIVTDKQRPEWLSKDSKIKIVDHSEIIPKKFLPTFNSNLIEWHIHKISGLSDRFIYFCDDFLVSKPLEKEDFFTPENHPIYRCFDDYPDANKFIKKDISSIVGARTEDNSTLQLPHFDSSFEIVEQRLEKKINRFFLKHAPIPFHKNQLDSFYNNYIELISEMAKERFRSTKDISSQFMIAAENVNTNKAQVDNSQASVFEWVTNKNYDQSPTELMNIFSDKSKFISIATGNDFDSSRINIAVDFLKIKFPLGSADEVNKGKIEKIETFRIRKILEELCNTPINQNDNTEPQSHELSTIRQDKRMIKKVKKIGPKLKRLVENRLKSNHDALKSDKKIIKTSKLFNAEWYLDNNSDVKENNIDPLSHFITHGASEDRDPSEKFSVKMYKALNPEVDFNSINPLIHYVKSKRIATRAYDKDALAHYLETINDEIIESANRNKTIIAMESMDWFSKLAQRPHHLARLLADKKITVVYVDVHRSIPVKINKNLYIVNKDYDIAFKTIKNVKKFYWVFSTVSQGASYIDGPLRDGYEIIYDYIDDFDESISEGVEKQIELYNRMKTIKPRIIIASADRLVEQISIDMKRKDVVVAKNAVNIEHFNPNIRRSKENAPEDLKPILDKGRPVVGYYGALAPWLDYELINSITLEEKEKEFVFIGVDYGKALKNLIIRDNVHFLGPKEYEHLSEYSYWFDCALIPFQRGDIAKSTSPVKLFEYMAMGVPTVCTADLKECYGYDFVYIAKNKKEYKDFIEKAISVRRDKKVLRSLTDSAKNNTWRARVESIYEKLK